VDVAPLLGVGEHTIVNWERGRSTPPDAHYPKIIAFLGYEPWSEPLTQGERLRAQRLRRGLSIKRAALYLGIYESTFAEWERDARKPLGRLSAICDGFLTERMLHNS